MSTKLFSLQFLKIEAYIISSNNEINKSLHFQVFYLINMLMILRNDTGGTVYIC